MAKDLTILDEIIEKIAEELYLKWLSAIPEENKNEDSFRALQKNAHETTILIIQSFMNRFNEAAEELKDK